MVYNQDTDPMIDSFDKEALLSQEVPLSKTTFQEKLMIAKELSTAAISTIFATIGTILKDVISLYFIGHLNNPLLFAAAGFGLTWLNSFGTAVFAGLAGGFGTLASHAFGARNYYKFGLLYQKSLVVISCFMLGLFIVLWFTKVELVTLGFDEALATEVSQFIRYLLLDLFLFMIFETTKYYLIAQNIFKIPAYILLTSTFLHIFWCYLFVNILGWGLLGMAVARTITDGTSAVLVLLYVKIKNPNPESWFPWVSECLQDLVAHAKAIGSHGSALYVEWIAFELTTIVIGYLGDIEVIAAHSAAQNYLFANGGLSIGISIATSIFVGNAAGEGSLHKAQKYAFVGILSNTIFVTLLDIFMFGCRGAISSFYTSEPNVKSLIQTMLLLYSFGMHADLLCNALANTLRALGMEKYVLKGYLMGYYGVGVTCSLFSSIVLDYGFYGVWISLVAGCYAMLILMIIKFKDLNWAELVKKIALEMRKKSTSEASGSRHEIELM